MGLTRKIMGPTDLQLAKIMNDLGQAYELSGNNSKAEEYFEKALTIRQRLMNSPCSIPLATTK